MIMLKRTSRRAKRTSRAPRRNTRREQLAGQYVRSDGLSVIEDGAGWQYEVVYDEYGTAHVGSMLTRKKPPLNAAEAAKRESGFRPNPRGRVGATKEFAIGGAVGAVREAGGGEQLNFLPPGIAVKIARMPQGYYSFGYGKKGESLRPFKTGDLGGAMTSTRIAAQKSREFHWLVDNHGRYPVVIRIFDENGRTTYRVEEYARKFEKVYVERREKRTSRMSRAA